MPAMAGLRSISSSVPPPIPQNLLWNFVSQLVLDIAIPKISTVFSTVKHSGFNLIHAEKAVGLASHLGATPVLEIFAEAAIEELAVVPVLEIVTETVVPIADTIPEVTVPVLEAVAEVIAPIIDPKTTCLAIEAFSASFVPVVEVVEADPVIDVTTNVTGPIIDSVFHGIVSPIVSPTVPYDTTVTAGPLTELLDFTLDTASPRFLRPAHLISDNVQPYPPLLEMTAAYSIFLLLILIWQWAVAARRRVAEPDTGFAASVPANSSVPAAQAVSSPFPVLGSAHSSVSIPALFEGLIIDKGLLLVADFHTFIDGLVKEYRLPIEGMKELCNSYSTCLFPSTLVLGSPALPYEGFSLQPQLILWAGFGTRLEAYRKERQLSPRVLADLLECYVTGNFRKFCPWECSEGAGGCSGSGAPVSRESSSFAEGLAAQSSVPSEPSAENFTGTSGDLSPSSSAEVAEPSLSPELDDHRPTSTSPPNVALKKSLEFSVTPFRRRSVSVSDAGCYLFSPEYTRSPRTPESLKGVPLDHLMLGRCSGQKAARDLERRMSARIATFIKEEFGDSGTGRKTDITTPSDLDLASLTSRPCKKNLGRRGTPAPFGFKKNVTLSESDVSPAEDDLQVEGLSFVSQSDSDSLTEGAYEARFSRSSAPSPASDIGNMGNGFSELEDGSGSVGSSDEEVGSEYEDEIGGFHYSDEEEVALQVADEIHPSGSVPTVKLPRPSGNAALKFSLSPVEKYTPAVEVVSDEEDDEEDEEPQADLALQKSSDNTVLKPSLSPVEKFTPAVEVVSDEEDVVEDEDDEPLADLAFGNSSDNTVLKPSLSPVENYSTVEVVDESTTPPMSPRACLNALRTIPEGSDEDDDLSDTTVSPTSMDRNMREDKDTLDKQVQSRLMVPPKDYPFDESMEVSQEMQNILGTPIPHSNEPVQTAEYPEDGWQVVAPKGKGKATQGLGASIWAKQTPSGSSLGFSHLECAEGEPDSDDVVGKKGGVDLNVSTVVDTDQDPNADEKCEKSVADSENQDPLNKKSRHRGNSWWYYKQPRENHRNRGKRGWERKEGRRLREEAAKSRNAGASTSATHAP